MPLAGVRVQVSQLTLVDGCIMVYGETHRSAELPFKSGYAVNQPKTVSLFYRPGLRAQRLAGCVKTRALAALVKWQTRSLEGRVPERVYRFNPYMQHYNPDYLLGSGLFFVTYPLFLCYTCGITIGIF